MPAHVVTLRTALPRDRDAAVTLIQVLLGFEAGITGDDAQRRAASAQYDALLERIAYSQGRLVVAESDGIVVGLMAFVVEEEAAAATEELRRYGMVVDLVVQEEHRRQGVATMLLEEAERLTRAEGLQRLVVTSIAGNDEAERTYRAFGFAPFLTIMVKPLDH
jgi:GNAT superfamily N-acetyltransferase